MDANFAINHERLSRLYVYMGRFAESIDEDAKARMLGGEDPRAVFAEAEDLRRSLAARGLRGYWEKLLEFSKTGRHAPEAFAGDPSLIYTQLGETGKAMELLEDAYRAHSIKIEVSGEPALDPLRSDPRFIDLLRRMGLPQ